MNLFNKKQRNVLFQYFVLGAGLLSLFVGGESAAKRCTIHDRNSTVGMPYTASALPDIATKEWLFASEIEISRYYEDGLRKCKSYIQSNTPIYTDINPFPNPKAFPGGEQRKCRGVELLYALTGMIVFPFGPIDKCDTYSSCWYGLLTCGNLSLEKLRTMTDDSILGGIRSTSQTLSSLPEHMGWSIKSLIIYMRLVGNEIVVPHQKYFPIKTLRGVDDVIIAQYVLTKPGKYYVESKLHEFYPSSLFNWSLAQREKDGVEIFNNIFLGGCETRCRPWTKCTVPNACCGCNEKTFISSMPRTIEVNDGSKGCPNLSSIRLPLCTTYDTTAPGRWIRSSRRCNESSTTNQIAWAEASGDPCTLKAIEEETDNPGGYIYFAPYRCKFHFYALRQARQCLKEKGISHIHFQGDSMTRDLYSFVGRFLGIDAMNPEELKRLTNVLNVRNISAFHDGILISEGYSWFYDEKIQSKMKEEPYPQVIIADNGFAHREMKPRLMQIALNASIVHYWKNIHRESPIPKYMFYQHAKALFGKKFSDDQLYRSSFWSAEAFRSANEITRQIYEDKLGYLPLDEYILSLGRWGVSSADGWHVGGTVRQMQVVVLFNSICNDWLLKRANMSDPYDIGVNNRKLKDAIGTLFGDFLESNSIAATDSPTPAPHWSPTPAPKDHSNQRGRQVLNRRGKHHLVASRSK